MLTIDSCSSDEEEYGEYYDEEEEEGEETKVDGDAQPRIGASAFGFDMMDGVSSDDAGEEDKEEVKDEMVQRVNPLHLIP